MLPGIKNTILDGAMGVLGADATGRFAAIGVAANFGQGILTFTSPDQVDAILGDGPLRDTIISALSIAKTTVYAIALEGTSPGTLSAVIAGTENGGSGTITVEGSPRNEYAISIEITAGGSVNEGVFRITIDGSSGKRITIPDTGKYTIPGTGISLTFSGNYTEGDVFTFSSTEPKASNGEILAAVDTILKAKKAIEWIAITGVSEKALWAALAAKADEAAEIYQYLFFVAQARYQKENETLDQWANALTGDERGTVASTRLQVCAGWISEADPNGSTDVRGLIGVYCGKLAARNVHQGPDAVRYGSIKAALELLPYGINDGHIESLKEAGYVTARTIIDLKGMYITSGQMMCDEGSDYDMVERRRVMDKACREVRKAQLVWVNDAVSVGKDGSPDGIAMLIAQSENPLRIMKQNGEISDGYVAVPEGQNILSTKKIQTKVRIIPLGKLSYIENEIAYSNPAIGGDE